MARFRQSLRPINRRKNISETSGVFAASTNTVLLSLAAGVDQADLGTTNEVTTGSTINGMFLSMFFYTEGGEIASEVPLVDWYLIKSPGGSFGSTFDATNLPTPGATGGFANKRFIIHTEKGLSGGGDASLTGVPMIFKGVIAIPKGMRRMAIGDAWLICARANFATKFCVQSIYKWYS